MRIISGSLVVGLVLVALVACSAAHLGSDNPGAVVVGQAPSGKFGSWPSFRGPGATGFSTETGINKSWSTKAPRLLWQQRLTDDGYAGPSSAEGMVFIVDHQGSEDIVRAWSLVDGKEIWQYKYPDASASNYGFSRATPTFDDGYLYVVSRLGKVICFQAKDGKLIWQRDMVGEMGGKRPNWDYASSPIVDGDRLLVLPGADDAALVVLDKKTGKTLLKGGAGPASYSTPVIATLNGKKQYVVFLAKKLAGIDVQSGNEIWSYPWETAYDVNAATPLVIGDSVFITTGYGKGCAMVDVKGTQATKRWENKSIQAHFSSPVYHEGRIYGTGDPGFLVCLDPETGTTLWKQPGFEKGGMMGIDGVALVQNGSNGDLVMVKLDPSGYQELGRIAPLKGQAWTAPIVVDKKVIVRTKEAIAVVDIS